LRQHRQCAARSDGHLGAVRGGHRWDGGDGGHGDDKASRLRREEQAEREP